MSKSLRPIREIVKKLELPEKYFEQIGPYGGKVRLDLREADPGDGDDADGERRREDGDVDRADAGTSVHREESDHHVA